MPAGIPFCSTSPTAPTRSPARLALPVDSGDVATIGPCVTHTVRAFCQLGGQLTSPDQPVTRLELEPRVQISYCPA